MPGECVLRLGRVHRNWVRLEVFLFAVAGGVLFVVGEEKWFLIGGGATLLITAALLLKFAVPDGPMLRLDADGVALSGQRIPLLRLSEVVVERLPFRPARRFDPTGLGGAIHRAAADAFGIRFVPKDTSAPIVVEGPDLCAYAEASGFIQARCARFLVPFRDSG